MLMMGGQVARLRKHPFGRVDQLEDRYLGMVEAPSSNLGTSTLQKRHTANALWVCQKTQFLFWSKSKFCFKRGFSHIGLVGWRCYDLPRRTDEATSRRR